MLLCLLALQVDIDLDIAGGSSLGLAVVEHPLHEVELGRPVRRGVRRHLQGYLAYKKPPPRRTLPWAYA